MENDKGSIQMARQKNKKKSPWLVDRARSLFLPLLIKCFSGNLSTLAITLAITLFFAVFIAMKYDITHENIVAIPELLDSLLNTTVKTILDTQSKAICSFFNFLFAIVAIMGWLHQYALAHAPDTDESDYPNSTDVSSDTVFCPSSIGEGLRLVKCRFNFNEDSSRRIEYITVYFTVSNKTDAAQSVIIAPCMFMNNMNAVYRFTVRTYIVPAKSSIITSDPCPLNLDRKEIEKIIKIQHDNNYNNSCCFQFIINSQTKYEKTVDIQ